MVLKFKKMFDAADTKVFFLIRIEYLRTPLPQSFKTTYGS